MRCGLVDPVLSGFNYGRRCKQSRVFVLCKSMHMKRRGGGWWAVWPRSSRRTDWVMETESQVSVSLPGERVSWLRPGLPRHHQDTVSLRLYPTDARDKVFFFFQEQMYLHCEMLSWWGDKERLTLGWGCQCVSPATGVCVCVCYEGRHTSGVRHAKRHWSSEPSRELKDPEYADKDKTPGVCICTVSACERGCEKENWAQI